MSKLQSVPRRRFLAATGTVLAVTATAALRQNGLAAAALPESATQQPVLVLYRDSLALAREFALHSRAAGLPVLALAADPVRQWRDDLAALVGTAGWRIAGQGNWMDYSIVRGLAAEQRRLPLVTLQHGTTQLQRHGIKPLADLLLAFAQENDAQERICRHALLTDHPDNNHPRPDLFSWVI